MEQFVEYLITNGRLDEAANKLAEIINREDFVSKAGKSKHQVPSAVPLISLKAGQLK